MSPQTAAAWSNDPSLLEQLEQISQCPVLLVASDFDGTLAPIVNDPLAAEADRETTVALRALAEMPQTHLAIISGRALGDLAGRVRAVPDARLVGSHGSEFEAGITTPLSSREAELLSRLNASLRSVARTGDGLLLETKPASLAFHYRNAEPAVAERAVDQIMNGPATWPGVHTRQGKMVLELSVIQTHKGAALQRIRTEVGASAVLYLGDDITDEDAFATLSGPDVGIKVGPGESAGRFRAADVFEVSRILAHVAERRAAWLSGASATPIEKHTLLSDQRTMGLVDPRGRLVWMCLPRVDSSAVFAELVGGPMAGFFEICPSSPSGNARQRYVGNSLVVETEWPGLRVTDYFECGDGRATQRAGRTDLVRVVEGRGTVRVTFAPRLDFGRAETRLSVSERGIVVEGTPDSMILTAPRMNWQIHTEGRHQIAVGTTDVTDQPLVFELRYGTANMESNPLPEAQRRERTLRYWSSWSDNLTLPARAKDHVLRSALTLKALCYEPTGAIVAAGTTSLPEHIGGVRNWDYRFCWPRDAAMSAAALVRLGEPSVGVRFLDWLLGILERTEPGTLPSPLYTVTGAHSAPEGEIRELVGYCGSRPVRVGNAASHQIQLDVFGPIAELVALLADRGTALSAEHWWLMDLMVDTVSRRWQDPDNGIWEVRSARQHFVHSKVMCWQTVDRALKLATYLGRNRPDWFELRDRIASDVLEHGWKESKRAFCVSYGQEEPDSAALTVGLSGLLAPDDPKFLSTIEFVERTLLRGYTVYRYFFDDGLPGHEGGFNLCTSWLIEAYALVGRRADAEALFSKYLNQLGPTGLMTEEFDPRQKRSLGNFPQAYSHLGLINAALALESNTLGN